MCQPIMGRTTGPHLPIYSSGRGATMRWSPKCNESTPVLDGMIRRLPATHCTCIAVTILYSHGKRLWTHHRRLWLSGTGTLICFYFYTLIVIYLERGQAPCPRLLTLSFCLYVCYRWPLMPFYIHLLLTASGLAQDFPEIQVVFTQKYG